LPNGFLIDFGSIKTVLTQKPESKSFLKMSGLPKGLNIPSSGFLWLFLEIRMPKIFNYTFNPTKQRAYDTIIPYFFVGKELQSYKEHVASCIMYFWQPWLYPSISLQFRYLLAFQVNYVLNTILSLNMVITFLVALTLILDNIVPGGCQERGLDVWSEAEAARRESTFMKDYELPFKIGRPFRWVKCVGL
jgi:hypothetical protein